MLAGMKAELVRAPQGYAGVDYESHLLESAGWCPNNPGCPLLVYRQVLSEGDHRLAARFEHMFEQHGWAPAWRYTIYDFPHFHSTTHEVIAVFQGSATVQFGDTAGSAFELEAGDVVLIPAGVSHQRLDGTDDFQCVGAYPAGCRPDQVRKDGRGASVAGDVRRVPVPESDPVAGADGPMHAEWGGA